MKKEIQELIEYLEKNSDLWEGYELEEGSVYANFYDFLPNDWDYCSGASKVVFINPTVKDKVIKIPIVGRLEDDFYYDDDEEDWIYSGEGEFYYYCGADNGDTEYDYCSAEVNIYKAAEEAGLEACFAKTERIGSINGYPVYMQDKAEMLEDVDISSHTREYIEKTVLHCRELNIHTSINKGWFGDFIAYHGDEMAKRLIDFINKFHINDLHTGNIGYISGIPVLVDYSGFYS